MTYADNLGIWQSIGEVTLTHDWQLFDEELISGETLRFTYIVNWNKWKINIDDKAYIIGRFYYPTGDDINVSPSFKLIPKLQQEVRQYKIPDRFNESGTVIRSLGVKAIRYNRYIGTDAPIDNLKLKAEYLI